MSPVQTPSPIDLTTPVLVLNERLVELNRREARLWERDSTCKLKEAGEGQNICLACPFSLAEKPSTGADHMDDEQDILNWSNRRVLCRTGREQQEISLLIMAKAHRADSV